MSNKHKGQPKQQHAQQQPPHSGQAGQQKRTEPNRQDSTSGTEQSSATQGEAKKRKLTAPDWWMVGLTTLLFVISCFQWQATRDAISAADDQFRKGNRAFMTVMGHKIRTMQPKPDGTVAFVEKTTFPSIGTPGSQWEVEFKNTGNTPALKVRTLIASILCTSLPADTAKTADEHVRNPQSVPVAKDGNLYARVETPALSEADLAKVLAGEKLLVAFGFARYLDIFGNPHRTDFCFRYDPVSNGRVACERGNDID